MHHLISELVESRNAGRHALASFLELAKSFGMVTHVLYLENNFVLTGIRHDCFRSYSDGWSETEKNSHIHDYGVLSYSYLHKRPSTLYVTPMFGFVPTI